jgi:hypothetical protein
LPWRHSCPARSKAFLVNYNVSNVDQVYLPIAIEPMVHADRERNNATNTIGYLGTTLRVKEIRERLMTFTGATGSVHDPENPDDVADLHLVG